jgi:hypothetical protein
MRRLIPTFCLLCCFAASLIVAWPERPNRVAPRRPTVQTVIHHEWPDEELIPVYQF